MMSTSCRDVSCGYAVETAPSISVVSAQFGRGDQVCAVERLAFAIRQRCNGLLTCEFLAAPELCPEDPPGERPRKALRVQYRCGDDMTRPEVIVSEGQMMRMSCDDHPSAGAR